MINYINNSSRRLCLACFLLGVILFIYMLKLTNQLSTRLYMIWQFVNSMNQAKHFLPIIILIRLFSCFFLTMGENHPDEYASGIEIAHRMAFGYGTLSWQWYIDTPIRGSLYPWCISLGYELLKFVNLSETDLIVYAPKLFQVIVSVLFDTYLLKLSELYNPGYIRYMLVINYLSYFSIEVFSRLYSNNIEATFTLIAFYYWNKGDQNKYNDLISRLFVIVGFYLRGTIVIFWAIVWPYQLLIKCRTICGRILFIFKNLITLLLMVVGSMCITYIFTERFQLVEWNFLYINLVQGVSKKFGTNNFFDYIRELMPEHLRVSHSLLLMLGLFCIFLFKTRSAAELKKNKQLFWFSVAYLFVLSSSSHQQYRLFIPLTPYIFVYCVNGLRAMPKKLIWIFLVLTAMDNYKRFHNQQFKKWENIQAVSYLRNKDCVKSVFFMTRTYVIPYYAVLHKNIPLEFIKYDPFVELRGEESEIAQFSKHPQQIYEKLVQRAGFQPTHIITEQHCLIDGLHLDHKYKLINKEGFTSFVPFEVLRIYQRKDINCTKEIF